MPINMQDNPRSFARSQVLNLDQLLITRTLREEDWKRIKARALALVDCCDLQLTRSVEKYDKLLRKGGKK